MYNFLSLSLSLFILFVSIISVTENPARRQLLMSFASIGERTCRAITTWFTFDWMWEVQRVRERRNFIDTWVELKSLIKLLSSSELITSCRTSSWWYFFSAYKCLTAADFHVDMLSSWFEFPSHLSLSLKLMSLCRLIYVLKWALM